MVYLHLKFENSGLIYSDKKTSHITRHGLYPYENKEDNKYENDDYFVNPIPYWLLSNVLHSLAGEVPVPTKKETFIKYERISLFDEIAKGSYVKYNNVFKYKTKTKEGEITEKICGELFNTNKYHWNSGRQCNHTFTKKDGTQYKVFNGFYSWDYFRRSCVDENEFKEKIGELERMYGVNPLEYTLNDFVVSFREKMKGKVSEEILQKFKHGWSNIFFCQDKKGNPTEIKSRVQLNTLKGVMYKVVLNGDIICPIDTDEETEYNLINRFKNGKGVARLLDDGICYITGIEKCEPINNFREKYEKIFIQ